VGPLLLPLLLALQLLEVVPLGRGLHPFPQARLQEPWIAWLRAQPDGAVAMVPAAPDVSAAAFEPTVVAMLQGLEHGHPLANGYSGFFPLESRALRTELQRFPSVPCLKYLRELKVRYVVAERQWLREHYALPSAKVQLTLRYEDAAHLVFEL
jgi:hypothetical protein